MSDLLELLRGLIPRGPRPPTMAGSPGEAVRGDTYAASDALAAALKKARNAALDQVATENSPLELVAQQAFPDYRSENRAGIYAENPDLESMALGMHSPIGMPYMRAPIAVHASPVKWSGKPTRAKAGTGEGGAAYGEGLYASVPENAKGLDARYRAQGAREWIIPQEQAKAVVAERLRDHALKLSEKAGGALTPEGSRAWKQADFLENSYQGTLDAFDVEKMLRDYTGGAARWDDIIKVPERGSFHVWDVPDNLLDWEKPLARQSAEVQGVARETFARAGALPEGIEAYMKNARGSDLYEFLRGDKGRDASAASDSLRASGIPGHTYAGEAGSAMTSGLEGAVPNFVIYDETAIKPLGTFSSADEWLSSELYKELSPRIQAEALQRALKMKGAK